MLFRIIIVTYYGIKPSSADPCHHGMAGPQVADGGTASDMEGRCQYIEKQSGTADKGCSSSFGAGRGANNYSP
jgi:hypothetical protein